MKILVLLKQTFDTEEKIQIDNGQVMEDGVKYIINPYDEYALEEALRLRERLGSDIVEAITVVCAGPERCCEALRTALAMGADDAVLVQTDSTIDDEHALSVVLASFIVTQDADLILAGLFSVDRGAGQTALRIAELLSWPHASAAVKLEVKQEGEAWKAYVDRDVEGDTETVELSLPALITSQQGLNEPRYPSLPGIMKAKRKPLRIVTIQEISSSGASAKLSGSPSADKTAMEKTKRTYLSAPPSRAAGKKLQGTAAEQAAALVKDLRDEAKLF
ncbi:electron transfer flavoprotein subunit beta [Paenibacillus tarimensis]